MYDDMPRWNAFLRRILPDDEGKEGGNSKTAQRGVQGVRKVTENYRGPCEGGRADGNEMEGQTRRLMSNYKNGLFFVKGVIF